MKQVQDIVNSTARLLLSLLLHVIMPMKRLEATTPQTCVSSDGFTPTQTSEFFSPALTSIPSAVFVKSLSNNAALQWSSIPFVSNTVSSPVKIAPLACKLTRPIQRFDWPKTSRRATTSSSTVCGPCKAKRVRKRFHLSCQVSCTVLERHWGTLMTFSMRRWRHWINLFATPKP